MYSSLFVLGALAGSALSQAITFANTTFTAPVTVGSTWPIAFSAGNSDPVSIYFGNSTTAFQIVDSLAAPGTYKWTVAVPAMYVTGPYQLSLKQGGADYVFSPVFNLVIPDGSSTTNVPTTTDPFPSTTGGYSTATVTAIYLPYPVNATYVTYIYYEEACGCHQTSSCPVSAMPTATSMTTATYSAEKCGCTTTIEAPCAETVVPVAPSTPQATNTPIAPSVSPAAPAATMASPSGTTGAAVPTYTGAGSRLTGSSFGLAAVVAALVVA